MQIRTVVSSLIKVMVIQMKLIKISLKFSLCRPSCLSPSKILPFLPGNPDILICGNCREMFSDLVDMLDHKKNYCKMRFTCKCESAQEAGHECPSQNASDQEKGRAITQAPKNLLKLSIAMRKLPRSPPPPLTATVPVYTVQSGESRKV